MFVSFMGAASAANDNSINETIISTSDGGSLSVPISESVDDSSLGVSNDAEVLSATYDLSGSTVQDIQTIFNNGVLQPGDTLYLGNQDISSGWTEWNGNEIINVNVPNIIISGGSSSNPNGVSTIDANHAKVFNIQASGVTLTNIKIINSNGGNGPGSAVAVDASDCTITNCEFENCENQYGGAVRATTSASNLKIENCNFSDNRGRWGGFGGAVYLSGPDATVENCIFNNNNAEQYGGAIYSDEEASNTKVIDCTFIDNHGAIGGAIYAGRPGLTVDGCEFEDNTASTSGGAISIYHDDATISNSNFTNNNASIDGGAIYVNDYCYNFNVDSCDFTKNNALGVGDGQGGGAIFIANDCEDITVQNSNFTSNTANTGGGAIRMEYTESMEVENSIFKDNVAKSIYNNPSEVSNGGGAIWSCRGETTIRNSTFERNQGSYGGALRGRVNTYDSDFYLNTAFEGNGGAIDVTIDLNQGSTPDLKYVNTTFVNNTAKGNRDDERAQGGALHMYKINHVDIIDCECYNNTADRGGAIDLYIIGTTNVDNCIIENNSAIHEGGGFFINTTSTPSEFKNTVVSNNDAGTEGGAIFLIANGALFENITSSNNTANIGGSSYIKGNDTTVRNCTLDNNSATTSGGGFYVEGDNCHVEDVILTNNTAEEGGAIYVYGNSAYFDNITSANNTADYYGGSLNVQGDNVIVKNSNFTDNEAFLGGGAIYVSGHEGKFQNNTIDSNEGNMGGGIYVSGDGYEFSDNNVTDNKGVFGGGIVIDGSNTLFTNNNISSNHASSMGGAVYADGENTNFTHNTFSDNTAYWSGGALYVDGENTYLEDIIGNNNTAQNGGFADVDWATNLIVKNSTFIDNHATGNIDDGYGLGGAFHISGSEGVDLEANFYNNTATNGSAIYVEDSTLRVHDSNFFDNQAWSYQLNLTPKPNTRFNRTDDITISVSHQGGDNIANAIHNANGESDVQVKNITYPFYTVDGQVINKTTPKDRYVTPVDSPDADDIYLYDFENNQVITLVLYNGNGSFVYNDETGEYEYVGEGEEINRFTYIVHPLYEIQNQGNEINVTQCGKNSTYTFDDDTGKYVCNNSGKITTCDYESVNPEVDQYTFNESGKITVVLHNKTNNKYTFNLPDGKVTEFYYNETTGEYIFEDNGKQRKYYAIEKTDIYGTIDLPLTKIKGTLDPGNYTVSAFYKESTYYTEIFNYTNFEVIGDLSPNMTVEKVSLNGTDFVIVNDTVAFNITVFNTGGCDLHNVNVTDVFSAGDFTFVGYSEDKGWTRVGESFVFTYGTLAKGENTTFTVWFMTLTNGTLPNNVTARSNETNDTNDTANVTVYSPNMTVEKVSLNGTDFIIVNDTVAFNITVNNTGDCNLYNVTVDELFNSTELEYIVHSNNITWIKNNNTFIYNATLGAGDIIVYEITIYNRGGCTIENITLIDVYNSTELEYVGSIDDNIVVKMDDKIFVNLTMNSNEILKIPLKFKMLVNGTLTNMSPSVDYDIKNGDESADNVTVKRVMKESYPTLHVGESSTFTIWFKAKTNGTLVNNVTARSNETNDTNDTANVTVYSPNMTVEKVSLNITDDVHINDTVAFNITVFNTGDCDLHIVNVSDIFDGNEFTFVGYSEDKGWTRVGNSYVFTYGTLAKGANATFTVWFRTLTNGTLVNNVTARSNETNETNDTANVTVYKRISINVTKVWDDANDQDGIRPDNISVELRNDTGV
ncbi:right-handed parallel beta-helix repeat-containing protein, partial [Methanobrevibacter sp.]|uniref:right-handed parallel beta-helix repeat-containing protein n=1 Tax=Methanobrevibacter sp. TaxID=66852 RepID=UPI00386F5F08